MTGNILNFILNAVFLFRFHLGVQGVASATVISKVVNLILIVIFVRRLIPAKKYSERVKVTKAILEKEESREVRMEYSIFR